MEKYRRVYKNRRVKDTHIHTYTHIYTHIHTHTVSAGNRSMHSMLATRYSAV